MRTGKNFCRPWNSSPPNLRGQTHSGVFLAFGEGRTADILRNILFQVPEGAFTTSSEPKRHCEIGKIVSEKFHEVYRGAVFA